MPGRPLDRDDLLELFAELSAELHAEQTVEVIIAGGSFMALRQLRETTEDVDSVRRLAPEFATLSPGLPPLRPCSVARRSAVALRHGLDDRHRPSLPCSLPGDDISMNLPQAGSRTGST
ncbi:MAG: hypothetical protein WKF58_19555 [Ilumatobacteraceae bacterium]